ncbi:PfkB family carbohydrate kinase [Lacticaseibacillus sp. N501-2]|uniref:PfkB family carbohydrate kinase n=1 Tax=Lacticaseibacillus salsurae TaxID=3367729 RepID=UPI0038B3569C
MKLIAVGDNVTDTYVDEGIYYPGGNCINVAVDAKKAGATSAGYMGIFGNDVRAMHIQDALDQEDVEQVRCRRVYAPTAMPKVIIAPDGDRQFQAGPQDSAQHLFKLRLTQTDRQIINSYDVLHTSIYSNIEADLTTFDSHVKIAFDFSDCRDEDYLAKTLPLVDLAFFSGSTLHDDEAESLAAHWLALGPEVVVITRGGQPALLQTATQRVYQRPEPVDIVDTMGAGDSFIAGFLVAYADGKSLDACGVRAAANAKATCQLHGGFGHGHPFA